MKKSKKTFKIVGIIVGIIVLLLIVAVAATEFYLEPHLEKKLRNSNQKLGNVEYAVSFNSLNLQALLGNLHLEQLEITPVKSQNALESENYKIVIDDLKIKGVEVFDYLFNNKLEMSSVVLEECNLVVYSYKNASKKEEISSDSTKSKEVTPINSINLKSFQIRNSTVTLKQVSDTVESTTARSGLSLTIENIMYEFDGMESFNFSDIQISLSDVNTKTADSLLAININSIDISGDRNSLNVKAEGNSISTRMEKYALAQTLGHEHDWIDMDIPTIKIAGIDLDFLFNNQSFITSSIEVLNPKINVFRDKRLPFPDKENTVLPDDFVRNLDFKLTIDSILVKNGNFTYQEHVEAIEEAGQITFSGFYASIYNITNDSTLLTDNPNARMSVRVNIMDAVPLTADFTFPLDHTGGNTAKGSVGEADLTIFNPMLSKVGYASIESGRSQSLDFNFTYNDDRSTGELIFKYDNLKIETISQNDGDDDSFGQNIKSFLANNFVVKSENPDEELRKGEINFERNKKKSVINFWWKSLLTGIQTSIGLKGNVQQ